MNKRFDLNDQEWGLIEPLLPQGLRGARRTDDRRILNGIFYVLRAGCPWRDLPERYVKILHWDGSGLCLYAKRMEKGAFVWPPILDERMHLTSAQLALLIEGIDWRRTVAAPESQRPAIV